MMPVWQAGAPLGEAVAGSALFRDWLAGRLPPQLDAGGGAAADLGRALDDPPPPRGPWFAAASGPPGAGPAVVVTGQQPGFLGGPLYTLLKAATTVALAELRGGQGRPTLPLLWSGDDDDDLAEALEPVGWDPAAGRQVGAAAGAAARRRREPVGSLDSRLWDGPARELLGRLADRPGAPALAGDLAALWEGAAAGRWGWARLQRELLLRLLGGHGLQVVSGDDPALHAAAGPLYGRVLPRLAELGDLARRRGEALAAGGWHAQIGGRSLARPLFHRRDGRRLPLAPETGTPPAGHLRPGVLLRSPVQDWLLAPVAVIAGPGELAYLRQLDPLYAELGIPRCALVPRLFAWLLPPGFDPRALERFRRAAVVSDARSAELATAAAAAAAAGVGRVLAGELGLDPERARALADGRARRWGRSVGAMLRAESRRLARERAPREPGWVFMAGVRQERRLALAAACALWGDPLVDAVLAAARAHLEAGLRGDWREFTIEVPAPERD